MAGTSSWKREGPSAYPAERGKNRSHSISTAASEPMASWYSSRVMHSETRGHWKAAGDEQQADRARQGCQADSG